MGNSKKAIQLSAHDNVLIVCQDIKAGEILRHNNIDYVIEKSISIGHKIAVRDIVMGENIIKFNIPIGSAISNIKKGAHVHVHNIKSDFIFTYTLEQEPENI